MNLGVELAPSLMLQDVEPWLPSPSLPIQHDEALGARFAIQDHVDRVGIIHGFAQGAQVRSGKVRAFQGVELQGIAKDGRWGSESSAVIVALVQDQEALVIDHHGDGGSQPVTLLLDLVLDCVVLAIGLCIEGLRIGLPELSADPVHGWFRRARRSV